MSEPIKVGDLVQIVRPTTCCGDENATGLVFVVQAISVTDWWCECGASGDDCVHAMHQDGECVELSRLKRIPPLSELDDVKQDEEITA